MTKIKIISNPFRKRIIFQKQQPISEVWEEITFETNPNSRLVRENIQKGVLSFQIQEIVDILLEEYDDGTGIDLLFEGNSDEFKELIAFAQTRNDSSISVTKSPCNLSNARDILPEVLSIFDKTQVILPKELENDLAIQKFQDATKPQIPLLVLGNYSAGKSTFINSLVGYELLPASDQPTTAKIIQIEKFAEKWIEIEATLLRNKVCIRIDEDGFEVEGDRIDETIITDLESIRQSLPQITPQILARAVLVYLNAREDSGLNIIAVKTAFTDSPLSKSSHRYVIFDTPGSNSSTNMEHLQILREAMAGMSNGLPIFISEYTSLDTVDNDKLYQELEQIDGIDLRYTILVVNKADTAALSTFQDYQVLNQALPRKLSTKRVFFLSSLMGLGSKTSGHFQEPDYERVYQKSLAEFTDASNPYYQQLYTYNILPTQQKLAQELQSKGEGNLLYANSGLYSLESEIEVFSTKYAAYNKCVQADQYLQYIISQTQSIIEDSKNTIEQEKDRLEKKLEKDKQALVNDLKRQQADFFNSSSTVYQQNLSEKVRDEKHYASLQLFIKERDSLWNRAVDDFQLKSYQKEMEESPKKALNNIMNSLGKAWDKKNIEILGSAFVNGFNDTGKVFSKVDDYNKMKTKAKGQVRDQLIAFARFEYIKQVEEVGKDFTTLSIHYWKEQTGLIKDRFSRLIGDASVLSDQKRAAIKEIIFQFQQPVLYHDSKQLFDQKSLLEGFRLGDIQIFGDANKIDLQKLEKRYNSLLKTAYKHINEQLISHHQATFYKWVEELLQLVMENIVEFSPDLQSTNLLIQDNKAKIEELTTKLHNLHDYSEELQELMAWKEDEEVTNGH
ncbi:TPA: dynamin family protein [Streptococcus suis]|nr:dynamin family protein [Streptococcus suis]